MPESTILNRFMHQLLPFLNTFVAFITSRPLVSLETQHSCITLNTFLGTRQLLDFLRFCRLYRAVALHLYDQFKVFESY